MITNSVAPGSQFYTDEYDIYDRLSEWGYLHKKVNIRPASTLGMKMETACIEVHVNTLEGFSSLLRSWPRPHRGISQEKLPCYLGFFEFVHNVRRRGKALLHSLLAFLLAP